MRQTTSTAQETKSEGGGRGGGRGGGGEKHGGEGKKDKKTKKGETEQIKGARLSLGFTGVCHLDSCRSVWLWASKTTMAAGIYWLKLRPPPRLMRSGNY